MKKLFLLLVLLFLTSPVQALEGQKTPVELNTIQSRVDRIGTELLNKNKIPKRMVFVYSEAEKAKLRLMSKTLTDRQIVLYDGIYRFIQSDEELAAALAREISYAVKSYNGMWGGYIDSIQVALGPKKFETVADKRAVDYMVKAGYNPLALIIFINKTYPQKKSDRFGQHNLTSKRLARIYEYITYKYPQYLSSTAYLDNIYYQNFLLNSINNRKMLEQKIETKSKKELKYE